MGLFHLYWIPKGRTPDQGAYVSFDHEEMLNVVAEECRRARAFAVGEDLGTVNPVVRERMRAWNMLGSKVVWFETDPPSRWPAASFASVSTHDLPTLAGHLGGADEAEQRALGQRPDADSRKRTLERIRAWTRLPPSADKQAMADAVHRMLARSPAALVAASLEDALGVEARPNLPGTTDERPNWRMPLPLTLDRIEKDKGMMALAAALARGPSPR
jgi:4-alpha-glucanotransferase